MTAVFTERELALIQKIRTQASQTVAQIRESCPQHSVCNPLPLFRLYKVDDTAFEAQWNGHHQAGPTQTFKFEDVQDGTGSR